MCSIARRIRPSCSGGTGRSPTTLTSKAGRSARAIISIRIWERSGSISNSGALRHCWDRSDGEEVMAFGVRIGVVAAFLTVAAAMPTMATEPPKRGGTLTYMIAADAPPSFDAHRELTFATVHSAAPFYSVLIRINPDNPASTSDFVCDLCTELPQPTDDGRIYTFKIRDGVKWHDGSPLS